MDVSFVVREHFESIGIKICLIESIRGVILIINGITS